MLLASIENMQYAVTVDVLNTVMICLFVILFSCTFDEAWFHLTVAILHQVFSAFGTVQKIAIFEKNGGTQALIQYPGKLLVKCLSSRSSLPVNGQLGVLKKVGH